MTVGVRVPSCAQRSGRHRLDAGRFFCGFAARLARLKPQVIAAALQVSGYWLWVRGLGRYAAIGWWGGVTPSCAPLTWGSLKCRRYAALLRLKP